MASPRSLLDSYKAGTIPPQTRKRKAAEATTSPISDDTLPNKRTQLASAGKQHQGPEAAPPTPLTTTTSHNGNDDSHSDADPAADDAMDSEDDFMSNLSSEDDMMQEDDSDNDMSNPEGETTTMILLLAPRHFALY